ELVVAVRRDERERLGEADLQTPQERESQRDEADEYRDAAVLDRDHLVILAPDVLRDEGLGIVEMVIPVGDCDVSHEHPLRRPTCDSLRRPRQSDSVIIPSRSISLASFLQSELMYAMTSSIARSFRRLAAIIAICSP